MSVPTRVDDDLYAAAQAAGETHCRSTAQQLTYWARIGRELEAAPTTSLHTIQRVLSGDLGYDDAGFREQAVVRVEWDQLISNRVAELDFEAEFGAISGESWTTADADGTVTVHHSGSTSEVRGQ